MKNANTNKKRLAIIAGVAAVMVAVGGGAAFAYWSSQGNASAMTATGTSTAFEVTAVTDATHGALAPGSTTSQVVNFVVKNTSTGVMRLSTVSAKVATSTGDAWSIPGAFPCSAGDYTVVTSPVTAADIAVGGQVSGTVTITMKNATTNQDACKGASVPIYITAG